MPGSALGLFALIGSSLPSIAITIGTSLVSSLVLGGISRALAPKPKQPQAIQFAGRTVTVRQAANPRQEIYGRARVGGTYVWMNARDSIGGDQWLHLAIVFAGHECDAIEEVWFDDYVLQLDADGWETGRYTVTDPNRGVPLGSYVRVRKYTGAPGQQADPILVQFGDGKWTADHRLDGCTYLAVLLTSNPDLFPNGIPQISAVIRGRKLYDDRTGLTAWTDNAALAGAHYLRSTLGATVNSASVIASANISDELVPLAAGGSERRYTVNGAFSLDETPKKLITDFANAMGGYAIRSGGQWYLEAGAYVAPSLALTDDDLRGPARVRTRVSRRENFNAVRGVFISPANHYQPDDFPPVQSATYLAEDQGVESWKDIELPFTASAAMAQRLAKIDLLRARQQITVEMPCKLTALQVRAGSVVSVTSDFYGWAGKQFRVTGFSLVVEQDEEGNPALGVNLTLREIAANVYDWDASEEQPYDAAPDTNLPDPFSITPPGAPMLTEELYETTGSAGVKARAIVTWGASASPFVDTYQLELRAVGAGEWTVFPRIGALRLPVDDISPGTYDFRVKAISQRGVSSAYATTRREIFALSGRPADVTGLTLQAISNLALLRWTRHPDLDVRIGGRIHIRHSEDIATPSWEESYSVTDPVPGDNTLALVPLKAGTYLVRPEDSSGNLSAAAATVIASDASAFGWADVGTPVQEDPGFTGAKSGTVLDGSVLKLSGSGFWDTVTDVDAIANVDGLGGFTGSGTYEFAAGIDLGSVMNVRLVATLAMETIESATLVDSRTELVDDWLDVDGPAAGGVGDAVLEFRQTNDNPAGSPTWSGWRRLALTADATARAVQFRLTLTVSDPAYNIQVSQLRVKAQEVT